MKKIIKIKQLMIVISILCATKSVAQFQITLNTFGEFGRTDQVIRGVGIGYFPNNTITEAALHVNTNYMSTSSNYPGINFGEVFRTDAPSGSSFWRMYTNASERIHLEWDNTNSASLFQSVNAPLSIRALANSPITFFTGTTNTEKVRITNAGEVGIGTVTPRSKFHVHEATSSTDVDIRLSNQTTGSTATDGSMITVDQADGDLQIANFEYGTSGSSNIEFYNPLSDGTMNLTMILRPRSTFPDRVGIGTNSPGAKLDVYDDFSATHTLGDDIAMRAYKIVTDNNPSNRSIGLYVNAENGLHTIGIHSTVDNETSTNNNLYMMGYYSRTRNTGTFSGGGTNTSDSYCYYAESDGNCESIRKYGYFADIDGTNSTNVYGLFSDITNLGSGLNYGVFASIPSAGTCTGGGGTTNCPVAAAYFNGPIGHIGAFNVSDLTFKDSVSSIGNARSILNQINPRRYKFKSNDFPSMALPDGYHYGVIAQEIAPILPELVKELTRPAVLDSNAVEVHPQVNHLSVNYIELIPLLIQAVKEQQQQIDSLIAASNPNPSPKLYQGTPSDHRHQIEHSNQQGVILNQNDPNPFAEHTTITYHIPAEVIDAKIIFYTSSGSILRQVKVLERGSGTLDVYASDLSSGIYTYSLIADGKVIDTKRMIKTK